MKVVGISGPSCSGKSTLVRHLRRVLPSVVVLYEDDFYLADSELPHTADGVENWDAPESFDLDRMAAVVSEIVRTGELPDGFRSVEESNNNHENLFGDGELEQLQQEFSGVGPVLLIDGIMLFQQGSPILSRLESRVLMHAPYEILKQRRAARSGYATQEGFWADPPGYFDKVVWPEFVKNYGFLYTDNYTKLSPSAHELEIVLAPPKRDMAELCRWAVAKVRQCGGETGMK